MDAFGRIGTGAATPTSLDDDLEDVRARLQRLEALLERIVAQGTGEGRK